GSAILPDVASPGGGRGHWQPAGAAELHTPLDSAAGLWPPSRPCQLVGGEAANDAALSLRPGQLHDNRVGGTARIPALTQRLGNDGRAADVDQQRTFVVEVRLRWRTGLGVLAAWTARRGHQPGQPFRVC